MKTRKVQKNNRNLWDKLLRLMLIFITISFMLGAVGVVLLLISQILYKSFNIDTITLLRQWAR